MRGLPPDLAAAADDLRRRLDVGAATAEDLVRLGARSVDDVARRDPREMYETLSALDGVRHAAGVRDAFAAAVATARAQARERIVATRTSPQAAPPRRVEARRPERAARPLAPREVPDRPQAERWRAAREGRRR